VIVSVRRVRRRLFKRWISRILEVFCFDRWGYLSAAVFRKFQFTVSIRSDPYAMIREGSLLDLFQRNFRFPEGG
jgi:hypothetical protein